jgi:branched-chain amino acid transport system substrate-binding protein
VKRRVVALLTLVLLAAWTQPLRAADEPYDVYIMLPLTGPAAFLGRDEAPAAQALEKYVNAHGGIHGRPLHFVVLDDQSNPATAIQIANQIIAKNVPVILGPAFGATCGAVSPLIETNGPVMMCLTPVGKPAAGSYLFVNGIRNRDYEANAYRFLKAKGVRKLALLQTTDTTGVDAEADAIEALKYPDLQDMQIVDIEHYAPADITVAAQIARIKASGAEAISNYVTGPAFGTALRGAFEAGWTGWFFTSSSNGSKEQMKQYVPFLLDKLIFGTLGYQMTGGVPRNVQNAKNVYNQAIATVGITDPTIGNLTAWDCMMIVIDALRKIGPTATAPQVRQYIMGLKNWAGIQGMYDFGRGDQRGLDVKATGAMRYDKNTNTFVVLSKPGGAPL